MRKVFSFEADCGDRVRISMNRVSGDAISMIVETYDEDGEGMIYQKTTIKREDVARLVGKLCDAAELEVKNQLKLEL